MPSRSCPEAHGAGKRDGAPLGFGLRSDDFARRAVLSLFAKVDPLLAGVLGDYTGDRASRALPGASAFNCETGIWRDALPTRAFSGCGSSWRRRPRCEAALWSCWIGGWRAASHVWLADRDFPACGAHHGRALNATVNLKNLAKDLTASPRAKAGSGRRCTPVVKPASVRQEISVAHICAQSSASGGAATG